MNAQSMTVATTPNPCDDGSMNIHPRIPWTGPVSSGSLAGASSTRTAQRTLLLIIYVDDPSFVCSTSPSVLIKQNLTFESPVASSFP